MGSIWPWLCLLHFSFLMVALILKKAAVWKIFYQHKWMLNTQAIDCLWWILIFFLLEKHGLNYIFRTFSFVNNDDIYIHTFMTCFLFIWTELRSYISCLEVFPHQYTLTQIQHTDLSLSHVSMTISVVSSPSTISVRSYVSSVRDNKYRHINKW